VQLGNLYREQVLTPVPAAQRQFVTLAAHLCETVLPEALQTKLAWTTGSQIMLASFLKSFSAPNFRAVPITTLHQQFPLVVQKIKAGDLARFLNLVTSVHGYGACVGCGFAGRFTLLGSASPQPCTFPLIFDESPQVATRLDQFGYLSWGPVAGLCSRASCTPVCTSCRTVVPTTYDFSWVKSQLDDKLCKGCAKKQLFNVKPPKFTRTDQRRFRDMSL
jgi:hypothetical protein